VGELTEAGEVIEAIEAIEVTERIAAVENESKKNALVQKMLK
jgi:hypothetical protein